MIRLAVIEIVPGGSRINCSVTHGTRIAPALRSLGGETVHRSDEWALPAGQLEPLQCLLDRHGYRWALQPAEGQPRTWAERLVAEVPADHRGRVVDACSRALADCPDHLALLRLAWGTPQPTRSGGEKRR